MDTEQLLAEPPYYAVIFTSQRYEADEGAYQAMASQMEVLAKTQQGYLGFESVRDTSGRGISISYWSDLQAIQLWKQRLEHVTAQALGKEKWYQNYHIKVARVEKAYEFKR